jgi:hypothetical protein
MARFHHPLEYPINGNGDSDDRIPRISELSNLRQVRARASRKVVLRVFHQTTDKETILPPISALTDRGQFSSVVTLPVQDVVACGLSNLGCLGDQVIGHTELLQCTPEVFDDGVEVLIT